MSLLPIRFQTKSPAVVLPSQQSKGASGWDLHAFLPDGKVVIPVGKVAWIPTGLFVEIPPGYEAQIRPRSGLSTKNRLLLPNSPGTIDSDYRGEILVAMINLGGSDFSIEPDMRIAQMVFHKFETVEWIAVESLTDTTRGSGGFGSTGL